MSTRLGGYTGKVLSVNLSNREFSEYPWSDEDRKKYLGGKIMAAKILYDSIKEPIEPLSPDNMLVFTTGPLTGTGAPSSSRFNISTLSPLTNLLTSSNCGGNFGLHLKKAGYDALIIIGKSPNPVWLEVSDKNVIFHDATDLWGKTTSETQSALGTKGGKVVIGPAGENLVRYASIISQERVAGRGGVGAVMGSKNLKAILTHGEHKVNIVNKDAAKEMNKGWINQLLNHPITGKILPQLGTANLVRRMQDRNMLATRNFRAGKWEHFDKISGEELADKYLVKNSGCITCPIRCSRIINLNGQEIKGPELETLVLLGANLDNTDLYLICELNYLLDELGMDTMSTAGSIAFAMELNEKNMWDNGLEFGQTDNLATIMKDIAYRQGIGDLLAEGSKRLAEKFGGQEFAINVKGMELAAYEPRGAVGQGLGYAVANRGGCHLNAGYMVFMEGLGLGMNTKTPHSKASLSILMQNLMEAVSAAGNCLFTTYALIPGVLLHDNRSILSHSANAILRWSGPIVSLLNKKPGLVNFHFPLLPHTKVLQAVTGFPITFGGFLRIGARGYNLERMFNLRMGLTAQDDTLPKRLTDEYQVFPTNNKTVVPLARLKKAYYRQRGWTPKGIPNQKTLNKLELER